jgi:hypothetical protein
VPSVEDWADAWLTVQVPELGGKTLREAASGSREDRIMAESLLHRLEHDAHLRAVAGNKTVDVRSIRAKLGLLLEQSRARLVSGFPLSRRSSGNVGIKAAFRCPLQYSRCLEDLAHMPVEELVLVVGIHAEEAAVEHRVDVRAHPGRIIRSSPDGVRRYARRGPIRRRVVRRVWVASTGRGRGAVYAVPADLR